MTIRQQWNALLSRLGLEPEAGSAVNGAQIEKLSEALASPDEAQPEEPTQAPPPEVTATRTDPKEDPAPDEPLPAGNAKAYSDDVRNFR